MPGWSGTFEEILDAIAAAGYDGVETTLPVLGDLLDQPERVAVMLARRGLRLAALAFSTPHGWTDPTREADELALADRAMGFLAGLARSAPELVAPRPRLALGGGRARISVDSTGAWAQMLRMYALVAERAVASGCVVNVHPTSTPDSIVRTGAHYDRLVAGLPPEVQLGPDASHIIRGDELPVDLFRRHLARTGHVHLSDARRGPDGEFALLGRGDADIPGVVRLLQQADYAGWLVAEEESPESGADPTAAVAANRAYLRSLGL